ncbi:hypothetical protein EVAR_53943_1 [Eumeta japonica]|uniref:Uncharacterized protein n=1 Tax=Eumeta variegata TaxID=151549 RepID=A0A4C1ZGG5_EUMVA|nr:hypothetical protein EVAR_53943_1 [Eumeta japonica]
MTEFFGSWSGKRQPSDETVEEEEEVETITTTTTKKVTKKRVSRAPLCKLTLDINRLPRQGEGDKCARKRQPSTSYI